MSAKGIGNTSGIERVKRLRGDVIPLEFAEFAMGQCQRQGGDCCFHGHSSANLHLRSIRNEHSTAAALDHLHRAYRAHERLPEVCLFRLRYGTGLGDVIDLLNGELGGGGAV